MLERSIKILIEIFPSFSWVGATVIAGKFELKSVIPLLVRSKSRVCFSGLYSIMDFSPFLFAKVRETCFDLVASMSKRISHAPLLAEGSVNVFDVLFMEVRCIFLVVLSRIESSSGEGVQAANISPVSSWKRDISRGRVFALRYWKVGTSAAYCQLDIQPITVRLPSGVSLQLTVA